jgi:hypothetical protein
MFFLAQSWFEHRNRKEREEIPAKFRKEFFDGTSALLPLSSAAPQRAKERLTKAGKEYFFEPIHRLITSFVALRGFFVSFAVKVLRRATIFATVT